MRIEDAIKQNAQFRNAHQKALINLLYTHNWVFTKQKEFFRQYQLTPQQYNVLRILKGQQQNPISTCDIRERMLDKNSDASRLVDRLFQSGLVNRMVSPEDKRKVNVTLSDKGNSLLLEIETKITYLDNLSMNLSEQEAEQLSALLDKMRIDDEPQQENNCGEGLQQA